MININNYISTEVLNYPLTEENIFDLQNRFYHPVDRELLEFCAANKYQLCCVQQKLYGELKHVVFNNYTALAITEAVPLQQLYVVIDLLSGEIIELNGVRHFHDADILMRMRPNKPELGDFFLIDDFMQYLKKSKIGEATTPDENPFDNNSVDSDLGQQDELPF